MTLTIALAQLNPTVGDISGNTALVRRLRDEAAALGADLVVCPELSLTGYPPEDLVLRPAFVESAAAALRELERESTIPGVTGPRRRPPVVVTRGRAQRRRARQRRPVELRFKHELPNYGVFDEKRVFAPGPLPDARLVSRRATGPAGLRGHLVRRRHRPPGAAAARTCCSSPNGSPFEVDKFDQRLALTRDRALESRLPLPT